MTSFKAITTQEEFDEAIRDRIKRTQDTFDAKLAEFETLKERNTGLEKQAAELNESLAKIEGEKSELAKSVEALTSRNKQHEIFSLKARVAQDYGLPSGLASRLSGEDETSLKADAEQLSTMLKSQATKLPPLKATEPEGGNSEDEKYRALLSNLV